MEIRISGADQLLSVAVRLEAASGAVSAGATQIVRKTAADIVRDAQAIVPVDTGFLKNSISFDMTGPAEASVGPTAHYGGMVEFGTSRMGPRPYMRPAVERNMPPFLAAVEQLGRLR